MDDRHASDGVGGSSGRGDVDTSTRRVGDSVVVVLAGEIDLRTAPVARAALDDALAGAVEAGPATTLVVDLAEVLLLSSKGMQLLISTDRAAAERGVPVRVVTGGHRGVLRPLQIGAPDDLDTYPTLGEALSGRPRPATAPRPAR